MRPTDLSAVQPSCDFIPELACNTLLAPQTGPDFSTGRTSEGIMMTGEPHRTPLHKSLDSQA